MDVPRREERIAQLVIPVVQIQNRAEIRYRDISSARAPPFPEFTDSTIQGAFVVGTAVLCLACFAGFLGGVSWIQW